jgi:uncharacterized protein (TIGR02145 family)
MKKTLRNSFWLIHTKKRALVQILMLIVLLVGSFTLYAQNKDYVKGSGYIGAAKDGPGFTYINTGDTVNFAHNITTTRNINVLGRGMLSFAGTADWKSSNGSFVNGYVRSHKSGAFVFPVGQSDYRPARISAANDADPTDAAYYTPALYDITALDAGIIAVTDESWIIQGNTAATITLTWSDDIFTLTWSNSIFSVITDLSNLIIAGWDGTKWVKIASAADVTSPVFGTASVLTLSGSVSTVSDIVPNDYEAYTLAVEILCPATVADHEGHIYKVTQLAGKCWTSNLRATEYDAGGTIPFAQPYYSSLYPDVAKHDSVFGLLYTWYSAVGVPEGSSTLPTPDASGNVQGICPDGWHIPSQAELSTLSLYALNEIKSTQYWIVPGTDIYGFDARPAGKHNGTIERFEDLYGFTGYWACDANVGQNAPYFSISYYCNIIKEEYTSKADGLSVRCVMD